MKPIIRNSFLMFLVLGLGLALAQRLDWKLLGTRTVKLSADRDVIVVGPKEGLFKAIKLTVRKTAVQFMDMKVHFRNGDVIDVQVRTLIPAGGETRVIDLPGANRYIDKVVFWYQSLERNPKKAVVKMWGLQ
jgi:hypothetical protein